MNRAFDTGYSSFLSASDLVVTNISIFAASNDLEGKVWNPMIHWKQKAAVFVRLTTKGGLSGTGECWCFDAAPDALIAFLRTEVTPNVLGRRVSEIVSAMTSMRARATLTARHGILASALSGIDIALWDLQARKREQPLWKTIDATQSGDVRLYASGGLYAHNKSNSDLAEEFGSYVEAGFTGVKMKVGGLSATEDTERVKLVRGVIGQSTDLTVDGVYSFDFGTGIDFYQHIKDLNIKAFQSPVPADQVADMKALRKAGVPVMGIEAEYREEMFTQLVEDGAVEILQVAPIACGGLTTVLQLADRTDAVGIELSPEVSSTAIATIVACHLSAAHPGVGATEYHMIHQQFFDLLPFSPADITDGKVVLPDRPGIGIDLPLDRVVQHFTQSV